MNQAGFTLLVRKRSGAAPSDLTGEYHACAFSTLLTNYLDGWGSATFSTGNRLTWSFRANLEGAPLDPASFDLEYGVAADGATEFRQSGGGLRWLGAVGPAGGYAIMAGGFHDTAPPLLMVCLR